MSSALNTVHAHLVTVDSDWGSGSNEANEGQFWTPGKTSHEGWHGAEFLKQNLLSQRKSSTADLASALGIQYRSSWMPQGDEAACV